jgi:hypothetical protein
MNMVLRQQLAACEHSASQEVATAKEELVQLKHERKACICLAHQAPAWSRDRWGYDLERAAKGLMSRAQCGQEATLAALRFCADFHHPPQEDEVAPSQADGLTAAVSRLLRSLQKHANR